MLRKACQNAYNLALYLYLYAQTSLYLGASRLDAYCGPNRPRNRHRP